MSLELLLIDYGARGVTISLGAQDCELPYDTPASSEREFVLWELGVRSLNLPTHQPLKHSPQSLCQP